VKETRGYLAITLRAFVFTLGALILAIATFAFATALDATRWIALVVLAFAALALSLWIVVSALYSLYVEHVADYDRTYGPLGAVVGFLM
jgi:membrane protein